MDDGSTDETAAMVGAYPVRLLSGGGRGPGAARNTGWRAAKHPLVWFVDADCVAEPDALERLLVHMDDASVGGVSGSYGIMNSESLLACLIHEEIIERHLAMPRRVDFLATFNVLYRRSVLDEVGGLDERFLKGQDAELSFRVAQAGYTLGFEIESRVKHYHASRWLGYLRTQRQQGYWRVFLHAAHAGHAAGDSYSRLWDHIQPPLAMLSLAAVPAVLLPWRGAAWAPAIVVALLGAAQVPMTWRIVRRTRRVAYALFAWMSFVRAYWRGIGLAMGTLDLMLRRVPGK